MELEECERGEILYSDIDVAMSENENVSENEPATGSENAPNGVSLIHLTVEDKDPLVQQEDTRALGTTTLKPNFNLKKGCRSVISSEEKTKPKTILITFTHA